MLSLGDIVRINAEIARLEKAFEECSDSSIGKVINEWIADLKKQLAEGTKKGS
jgi:hypothetical protein